MRSALCFELWKVKNFVNILRCASNFSSTVYVIKTISFNHRHLISIIHSAFLLLLAVLSVEFCSLTPSSMSILWRKTFKRQVNSNKGYRNEWLGAYFNFKILFNNHFQGWIRRLLSGSTARAANHGPKFYSLTPSSMNILWRRRYRNHPVPTWDKTGLIVLDCWRACMIVCWVLEDGG